MPKLPEIDLERLTRFYEKFLEDTRTCCGGSVSAAWEAVFGLHIAEGLLPPLKLSPADMIDRIALVSEDCWDRSDKK